MNIVQKLDSAEIASSCGEVTGCNNNSRIWTDPLERARRVRSAPNETAVRFWQRVERSSASECWPWKGAVGTGGYGVFSIRGKRLIASRRAYELAHGPIPDGLSVLHSCDNPPCCNPAHLRVGTHADNMRDMAARQRKRGGGTLPKLTPCDAMTIRERAKTASSYELAREYGVHPSRIQRIVSGKAYREGVGARVGSAQAEPNQPAGREQAV